MKSSQSIIRAIVIAAGVVTGGIAAAPAFAGVGPSDFDAAVPCDAFRRSGSGSWTVVAPATVHINNGTVMSFKPGATMVPNQTINGIAVGAILDRHCGNE